MISDIHANLEALEAVLEDIEGRGVDMIGCLGDVVGYGPDPVACLDLVESKCRIKLAGNHEYVALGRSPIDELNTFARESIAWTREQLRYREATLMENYEMDAVIEDAYLVHASPQEPEEWIYILGQESANDAFAVLDKNLCFFGHTHVPTIFSQVEAGQVRLQVGHSFLPDPEVHYLVNVGSVGQPRDNDPRACYVIYDSAEGEVTYHRVEYDFKRTQDKMTRANAPSVLIDRLAVGR
ncbi:MAG: metallophosphoesterase family protein [Candidatus Zixiibacteriota bacterium]